MASVNTPFTELVRLITDGESVNASITNRASQDLAQRTQALREMLASLTTGQTVLYSDAALQAGMEVGTPVYIDGVTFRPAKATYGSGNTPAPESMAVGVLLSKTTDTAGIVALAGRVSDIDWTLITEDGTDTTGPYYLSSATAGKLTRNRSAVAVYIGQLASDGSFVVQVRQPAYTDHEHKVFTLVGSPAGTVTDPAIGAVHAVTTPNGSARGWLPATPTYFPGWIVGVQIPTNAKFGYNLTHASDAALAGAFPPVPVQGAVAVQAGLTVTPSPLVINSYGIWWVDDTYGNAPWPVDYSVTTTAPDIQMWLTQATSTAGAQGVTSITGHASSVVPVEVLGLSDDAATIGALRIKIPALLTSAGTADEGALAVKAISGNTRTTGPVTARVKAGANVTVTGTHGDGTAGWYGLVTVAANTGSGSAAVADLSALNAAVTTSFSDFKATQLSAGIVATPVWEMDVSELAAATVTLTPLIWLYAGASAALPTSLTWQYKVVTPTVGGAVLATPAWSAATQLSALSTVSGRVYKLSLPSFVAAQGSRVLLRINRASTDSYTGPVGILRVAYTAV